MLQSRNVDDQSFAQIMEYALGRLPWLCPGWTDYNAHDPGVTILELMAWYKEMQQYHMNVVTDALKRKLLKLLGVFPAPPRPSACLIGLPAGGGESYPVLTRLESPQDICFELLEPATGGPRVEAVYVNGPKGPADMTDILAQPGLSIWPFTGEGEETELLVGLSGPARELRLWFEVDDKRPVARNPFQADSPTPRTLEWRFVGATEPPAAQDETHALSHSGFVTLACPQDIPLSDGGCGLPERPYLRVRQTEGGCEEEVRLAGVAAGRFRAAQQETWAKLQWFTVAPRRGSVLLADAVSREGGAFLFLREEGGLRFVESEQRLEEGGLRASFDGAGCVEDGAPNLLAVSQDALRFGRLLFPSTGLPNMAVDLALGGRQPLLDTLRLVCDTRCPDGAVRPALWRYAEELSACGPRDLVFSYDPLREQLVFGDGEHGAVPPRGSRGILVASLGLSFCGGGNVPADCGLTFGDGTAAPNTAAEGGRDAQSLEEAAAQFLRALEDTRKCAAEADYERAALATPGLRVASAKAIAGFDPDEPTGRSRVPVVTVVALPWSARPRPVPDGRFLQAVQTQLARLRPICTVVKVAAPRYVPVGVSAQVRGGGADLWARIRDAAEKYLAVGTNGRAVGDPVVKDDLMAALAALEGVLRVERLELLPLGPDCYADPRGDLRLKRDGVAYLAGLDVQAR